MAGWQRAANAPMCFDLNQKEDVSVSNNMLKSPGRSGKETVIDPISAKRAYIRTAVGIGVAIGADGIRKKIAVAEASVVTTRNEVQATAVTAVKAVKHDLLSTNCNIYSDDDEEDYDEDTEMKLGGPRTGVDRLHNETNERKWLKKFQELKAYRDKFDDCLVPQKYDANPQLGEWVNRQRKHYQQMKNGKYSPMNKERIKKLENIDFAWVTSRGRPRSKRDVEADNCKTKTVFGTTFTQVSVQPHLLRKDNNNSNNNSNNNNNNSGGGGGISAPRPSFRLGLGLAPPPNRTTAPITVNGTPVGGSSVSQPPLVRTPVSVSAASAARNCSGPPSHPGAYVPQQAQAIHIPGQQQNQQNQHPSYHRPNYGPAVVTANANTNANTMSDARPVHIASAGPHHNQAGHPHHSHRSTTSSHHNHGHLNVNHNHNHGVGVGVGPPGSMNMNNTTSQQQQQRAAHAHTHYNSNNNHHHHAPYNNSTNTNTNTHSGGGGGGGHEQHSNHVNVNVNNARPTLWTCAHCQDATYASYDDCLAHERTCKAAPPPVAVVAVAAQQSHQVNAMPPNHHGGIAAPHHHRHHNHSMSQPLTASTPHRRHHPPPHARAQIAHPSGHHSQQDNNHHTLHRAHNQQIINRNHHNGPQPTPPQCWSSGGSGAVPPMHAISSSTPVTNWACEKCSVVFRTYGECWDHEQTCTRAPRVYRP